VRFSANCRHARFFVLHGEKSLKYSPFEANSLG
jgi:hypothetical protein